MMMVKSRVILVRARINARQFLRPATTTFTARTRSFASTRSEYDDRKPFDRTPSFRLTQPPNPSWKYGDKMEDTKWREDEEKGWRTWDMENTPSQDAYKLLTSAIVPRPIAFVSSLSQDGVPNLAPFSYFSMVSHAPPLLSVSFALSPRRPKDTRENVLATRTFCVNIISEPFVEGANACSVESPAEHNEWGTSGLTMEPSTHIKPARVRESAISFECELYHAIDIPPLPSPPYASSSQRTSTPPATPEPTGTIILGRILAVHARLSVLAGSEDGGVVDPAKLRPVSRLGGLIYARLGEGFELERPRWGEVRGAPRAGDGSGA